jgi:selenocysteine-specific elongation factor
VHVIATAGHVDHGKSTLVQALTGTDPDRLEEEHRRGLSIQLGYCWTALAPVGDIAFVDVPGHERFISTMLSGIGPVPAVLFVVAADDPWMPQAAEHLAALDALGVTHAVVAVTRSDLADPAVARRRAVTELSGTSLRGARVVTVSARTGDGLDELRSALASMVQSMDDPDPQADVRLWVDRRFSIRGAGSVVTGTLPAGTICVGESLSFGSGTVRVRGVQSLGEAVGSAHGVARVALNLTGDGLADLDRGSVLVTPDAWYFTEVLDVRITPSLAGSPGTARSPAPPERPMFHIGATGTASRFRPLAGQIARLTLEHRLPLRVGDRALLRDPGSRRIWGLSVLDPAPPRLQRRGAARQRAAELQSVGPDPDVVSEVSRRGLVEESLLTRIGVPVSRTEGAGVLAAGWFMSDERVAQCRRQLEQLVREHDSRFPLDPGIPLVALAERLHLPAVDLVTAVVRSPLWVVDGRVSTQPSVVLPTPLEEAITALRRDLERSPFTAPTAARLQELGLDGKALAAAAKTGRLLRLAPGIVLLPGAEHAAATLLGDLPQPFTTSQARVRLGTSRRVILPLLEHLDRSGATRRLPDDRRLIAVRQPAE